MAAKMAQRSTSLPDMTSGVRDPRDRIILLEQEVNAAAATLSRVRARTSRVLAATSAFEKLGAETRSFERAVRTLTELSRANRDSVDPRYVSRELERLYGELDELRARFASELSQAPPPPPVAAPRAKPRRRRWWQVWK